MGILTEIEAFIIGVDKDIIAAVSALAKSISENGGAVLLNAAQAAVLAAEQSTGTSLDKFNAAKAAVIGVLETQGIAFVESAVNGAIEAAVAQNKANQAAAQAGNVVTTTTVTTSVPAAATAATDVSTETAPSIPAATSEEPTPTVDAPTA